MTLRKVWRLALPLAVSACGGGDPAGPDPNPAARGILIVSGSDLTDSSRARLTTPLIVEVHDSSGSLEAPGTLVRFEVVDGIGGTGVAPLDAGSTGYGSFATGKTDAAGRTGAFVWLGRRAGTVRIAISAPTRGVSDTAHFEVTPGALAVVNASPSDTMLYVGRSFTLRGEAQDQYGNARREVVAWSIERPGATVTSAGVVTASVAARYEVRASAAGITDTARVSAIPHGVLAAFDEIHGEIVTVELDGSNRTVRATAVAHELGVRPQWLAGSDRIVFSTVIGDHKELRVVDAAGVIVPFLESPPSTMSDWADASPAADGSWVYFAARDSRCLVHDYCLFRSRPDGSAIDLLGNDASPFVVSFRPSASPDGRRVVFTTVENGEPVLKVLNLVPRALQPWSVVGIFPQWSPTGESIAYTDPAGALSVVNTDGTGARVLVEGPGFAYQGKITWSPDGQYIARRTGNGLEVVVIATGEVLPLPLLNALNEPSWR